MLTEDGDFHFKVKPKEIGFYILKLKKDNFITLLVDKNENVEITGDARQLAKTYDVTGSAGSELLHELNLHKQMNTERVDSLSTVYTASRGKPGILKVKAALDSIYKVIVHEKRLFEKFIDKNTDSLASLIAIYQQFGREPMFNVNSDDDLSYFVKLDNALYAAYPGNQHAMDLHERVAEMKKVQAESNLAEAKLQHWRCCT